MPDRLAHMALSLSRPGAALTDAAYALAIVKAGSIPTAADKLRQVHKALEDMQPVIDPERDRQIVYCVALEPDSTDSQGDVMMPEDIEYTAHNYLAQKPQVGSMHEGPIDAVVVESYIAPQDLQFEDGMYGPQTVARGSWVIGIHVRDPEEWQKIVTGEYTGVSVGGYGVRADIADET